MNWLIWKEYRMNRLILGAGVVLLLLPHAIALLNEMHRLERWPGYFEVSSMFSLMVTQIVLAMLGGNAIAGERSDRSAEFAAYLPFSRLQHLASKLLFAPLAVVAIWGVNLPIVHLVQETGRQHGDAFAVACVMIAVTSLTFFCVSWFFSSWVRSSLLAIVTGLIAPMAIIWTIGGVVWWLDIRLPVHEEEIVMSWYAGLCIGLSLAGFIAGTWHYLRRVEP